MSYRWKPKNSSRSNGNQKGGYSPWLSLFRSRRAKRAGKKAIGLK